MTDEEKAELAEIVKGLVDPLTKQLKEDLETTKSNLQKKQGEWGNEIHEVRELGQKIPTAEKIAEIVQQTLDTKGETVIDDKEKKGQDPTTEETSADIKRQLIAEGKWDVIKKRISELPKEEIDEIESSEDSLVKFLKVARGQVKGKSFFEDDDPPSGGESEEERYRRLFNKETGYTPKKKNNYQPSGSVDKPDSSLRSVGRGLRTERK